MTTMSHTRQHVTSRRALYGLASGLVLATAYMGHQYLMDPIALDSRGINTNAAAGGYDPFGRRMNIMNPERVNARLREHEQSHFVERGRGVLRYDMAQLPSNSPIEDDYSDRVVSVALNEAANANASSDWMFWGLYDGHGGWTTSAKLREELINYVIRQLDAGYSDAGKGLGDNIRRTPSPETIDLAIKRGFLALDDEICIHAVNRLLKNPQQSKGQSPETLAPAVSGSCGLLAFYDTLSQTLRVAVTGDSRAVLGSKSSSGWTARALSVDQTGSNQREADRIRKEHPGEEDRVIRRGRVLGGLEPTRAFGDARYKWTRDLQDKVARAFFGRSTPPELRSPPYVTAEPEVTTTKVKSGDFLVMGSDGLFEMLSNDEVVSLVVQWMETHPITESSASAAASAKSGGMWDKMFGGGNKADSAKVVDLTVDQDAMKPPFRHQGAVLKPTVEDENVATHLIRNALGGADREQLSMLLSIPAPQSRRYRDDLTVTVIFFGDEKAPENGGIRGNVAATSGGVNAPAKAKL